MTNLLESRQGFVMPKVSNHIHRHLVPQPNVCDRQAGDVHVAIDQLLTQICDVIYGYSAVPRTHYRVVCDSREERSCHRN